MLIFFAHELMEHAKPTSGRADIPGGQRAAQLDRRLRKPGRGRPGIPESKESLFKQMEIPRDRAEALLAQQPLERAEAGPALHPGKVGLIQLGFDVGIPPAPPPHLR